MNSIHAGHHNVHDCQMNRFPIHDLQALYAVRGQKHLISLTQQVYLDTLANFFIIFDN